MNHIKKMHTYMHSYIHTCIHTYMHTRIHTYKHVCIHAYIHTYIYTYIHAYIHTYIHAYIHTYIHAYIHTFMHTYMHAYIHTYMGYVSKMAEKAEEQAERALNIIVSTVEQSSNKRKTLKHQIFETVSTLRTVIANLKDSGNRKIREIETLRKQVDEMGTENKQCREKLDKVHSAQSLGEVEEQLRNNRKSEATPSTGISRKPTGGPTRYVAPHTAQAQKDVVNQQVT